MVNNSRSPVKAQTKDVRGVEFFFAGRCGQQSIYFIPTSSEDTRSYTADVGQEESETEAHMVSQSRAQEALEIQLVTTESQLLNLTESLGTVSFL